MERENLQSTQIPQPKPKEIMPFLDRRDVVMQKLEKEALSKVAVIIEGPPIYLWPPRIAAFDTLQWRSEAFLKGWDFTNSFAKRIPEKKSYQYVLVDDLNYMPKHAENSDLHKQIEKLRNSSPEIQQSALFQPPVRQTKIISESSLASDIGTTQCSRIDAAFNARKILDQLGSNALLYAGNATNLMLAVVNPDTVEIRSEQLNMMMELYRILRDSKEFQPFSKKWTVEAITETFRHVWLGENGSITDFSKPQFHGSHFSFVSS